MRPLFVTWEYPPYAAGIGRYVQQMGLALKKAGHSPIIFCGSREDGREAPEETASGLVLRYYSKHEIGKRRWVEKLQNAIRDHHADFIEGADHWGECAAYLNSTGRVPVVIKAHSSNALKALRDSNVLYSWQKPLILLARMRKMRRMFDEPFCIRNGDLLLAPSRRILEEYKRQGMPLPENREVLPNPINVPEGWTNDEAKAPTLLLVGRLDAGKGIQYISQLLRQLVPQFPELRVELAGSDTYARGIGSMKEWLVGQCGEYSGNLHFLGQLNDNGLAEAYRRAWVVIVPSRWDNFPTVVLEAMARRKAIVASPHGGMPEMLEGTICRIADPANEGFAEAVADFIQDCGLRERAGASALKKAETAYNPMKIANDYIRFVQAML